ncbi:hypothetical protein AGDE_06984 [Angomonas deanei]|uniref:Uncharacterized protein n=1 Tax=Angomonas deanei TaxID=59799 RepID=A0A7G2C5H5_9TRYP|nr:hypothetical protein AGDE_06984 [Angomonas deanei]CAD2214003.1 hypothetical protein, conserved [Angomonas deanei]|eukprot:EPY36296.1 hypothetical protein AGDE_06984 [Angomonas deanei]
MAIHQNKVERQYSADRNKVQRCTLVSDGVSLKGLRQGNPRYADSAELRLITVDSSKAEEAPPKIYSLLWKNHYHSTRQVFAAPSWWSAEEVGKEKEKDTTTKGHYTAEWQGGPGVEYSKEDAKLSIFGSLKYLAKMEIPLPKRFSLTLNSQSSVVLPLQRMVLQQIGVEEAPPAEESMIGEHRYFWATQGPTWDSNLLKGFSNDYQSLHHAKRWYSILSVEVGRDRKKMKQEPTSAVSSWGAKGFMNVCFADSLRQYPRASVGVSLVSAAPRFAVDSFNKIMPSTFSCDFSWFVAFDKKKLESGFQPGKPEEEQFMRISPVETFRNMKCGVTWNFD